MKDLKFWLLSLYRIDDMSIYETSELNKNFRKWLEKDPEGNREF